MKYLFDVSNKNVRGSFTHLSQRKGAIHDEYPENVFGVNMTHKLPLVVEARAQTDNRVCVVTNTSLHHDDGV